MRLVIDGQRLTAQRTGVGRCLESLLAGWAEVGFPLAETLVVLRDPAGLDRVPRIAGVRAEVVGERWPGIAWECCGLAGRLRPDDLLFAPANLVPLPWRGRTVLVIYDTLAWTVPESFPRHVRWRFGWRYRHAALRADRVIVPSRSTADDVARVHGVPRERIRIAYPGPEPGFRPLPADAPEVALARRAVGVADAPFFLFVGKRSQRRNVPAILQAFARFHREHLAYRLVFVGPDGGGELPGPAAGTIRAGHVGEETLQGLLAAATALLYPSDYEGFGLPIVEALASGCPVVTLRNSALTEAGGDAPWYLDSAAADAIERALRGLAADPAVRRRHIERGLAHVTRFSRARFAEDVKDEIVAAAMGTAWATSGA